MDQISFNSTLYYHKYVCSKFFSKDIEISAASKIKLKWLHNSETKANMHQSYRGIRTLFSLANGD